VLVSHSRKNVDVEKSKTSAIAETANRGEAVDSFVSLKNTQNINKTQTQLQTQTQTRLQTNTTVHWNHRSSISTYFAHFRISKAENNQTFLLSRPTFTAGFQVYPDACSEKSAFVLNHFFGDCLQTVRPMLSDRCHVSLSVCLSVCLSVTFVHCGQTVGRIKMELGMRVGLGPGHIVLDGDPAPPPPKKHSPKFLTHICCGCMDKDATWYGGRHRPTRLCVRWGPHSPPQKGGGALPIFGPCLLWPNGWMDQDGTWHEGRPQPRRLCVR